MSSTATVCNKRDRTVQGADWAWKGRWRSALSVQHGHTQRVVVIGGRPAANSLFRRKRFAGMSGDLAWCQAEWRSILYALQGRRKDDAQRRSAGRTGRPTLSRGANRPAASERA
ncbi:hypothetical protein MTO96_011823 [Rhipicephalus appendiculatus]